MTKLLEQAIARAKELPPEVQDEIARVMMTLTGDEGSVYRFTPEEEAEQDEADAAEARGDYATDEEVRAVWAKYGL